jgi:hypothetical protein
MRTPELAELQDHLARLRAVLTVMDTNLELGLVRNEGVQDLQKAIDSLRANVWVMLTAWHRTQAQAFVSAMRVRRARETCQEVLEDLNTDALNAETPGYPVFLATIRELARTLEVEGE